MIQRISPLRLYFVGAVALCCSLRPTTVVAQVPANYQGPMLFGVCAYVEGDTSYYSSILSLSGYYKLKAQEQFRQYALAQAKGTPLKGSACRWSTSKEEITTDKASDKQLLGTARHSAKGVETGWSFNAALADATTQPVRTASAKGIAGVKSTGTTTQTTASTTSNTAPTASTTTGTTTTASGSTASNAQQSATGALSGAKSTATSSVNDAVTSSVSSLSTGASSAIQGMFHRGAGKSKSADQSAPPATTPVATSQAATPLGFESTEVRWPRRRRRAGLKDW